MYYMPDIPSNTRYINLNQCYSIKWNLSGTYSQPLSAVKCSEVILYNNTGSDISFKAGNSEMANPALITEFTIKNGQQFTVMGITNYNQLSCIGTGTLYGRAHYYSSTPQVRQ